MTTKVYIVDDDIQVAELLAVIVEMAGFQQQIYTTSREFIEQETCSSDIILLDLNMPDMDGIEVIRELAAKTCDASILFISGQDSGVLHSAEKLARAHDLHVLGSVTKPVQIALLQQILQDASQLKENSANRQNATAELASVDELTQAIEQHQLLLHYQPQVCFQTGKLVGVEALVRWQHPERGLVFPNLFISVAEENGLIVPLTGEVIRMAVKQSKHWHQSGLNVQVSLNISAENVTSLTLPEQLSDILNKQHVNTSLITLEVTESSLMGELVTSLDILTRLRMKGFELSIDDFGTGYSSLSQLHRIPFTELKVDQSFVMQMDVDKEARAIVKTCIMLGHELNMKVVAEGIENETIFNALKQMGCDIAQGYYIAKPMSADDFDHWLSRYQAQLQADNG